MTMAAWRTRLRDSAVPQWDGLTSLVFLAAFFLIGTLAGFIFSCLCDESDQLREYLLSYLCRTGEGDVFEPSLFSVIWECFRWFLLIFLLGFTALGSLGIPFVLSVRAFMLSYAVTTFARLFGLRGMAAALSAFGVTAFITVPVIFTAACSGFQSALGRLSHDPQPAVPLGRRLAMLAPCGGLLILAAALQWTVMPALLTAVCARLFS